MKKRKLLFLLVAVLSFALLLPSCKGEAPKTDAGDGADQQKNIKDYFLLVEDPEKPTYKEVTRIDGEIMSTDSDHDLVAVETKDLDTENNVIETVKVYDLKTGEVINEQSVKYPLYAEYEEQIDLDVVIDYPVIRVSKRSYSEESEKDVYDVSYYFAKKDSEAIRTTNKQNYDVTRFENGLCAFDMGDEVVWIDKNMEIIRSARSVAANGYEVDSFHAEYQGYLYAWNDSEVQVFNRSGMCCATYTAGHVGRLIVHVLDDGDVLIQDLEYVDNYEECDFILDNIRLKAKHYVMNFLDGTLSEAKLDFIVDELGTAYEEESDMPFALADGRDNQALIYRYANGRVSLYPEYVVMNNDLGIEYALKNETPGVQLAEAFGVDDTHYVAPVNAGGVNQRYLFTLDGKAVSVVADGWWSEKYIVSDSAIYDHGMNVVLDLENSEFESGNVWVDWKSNNVFLSKKNFNTTKQEWYLFDGSSDAPMLVTDGIESDLRVVGGGYYVTYVPEEGAGVNAEYTFRAADGTVLLITYGDPSTHEFDSTVLVQTEFEGKPMIYVLK